MKSKNIGIIGAMESEVRHLLAFLKEPKSERIADLTFTTGKMETLSVTVVQSGIGKVNAARCTQLLIDRFHPDEIVNIGIAGGVAPTLHVGDVVIATGLLQHDFDVTAFGHAKGYLCTGVDHDRPTIFQSSSELVTALEAAAKTQIATSCVMRGMVGSGDLFVASREKKRELWEEFGIAATEMEGAAIAQTAYYNGIPFAVLRVISDEADGKASTSFSVFEEETAMQSSEIIKRFLSTKV